MESATFASFLRGAVIVGFDLNEGQVISHVCPPGAMPDAFLKSLCSIAFPDTSSFSSEGELFYFIRLNSGDEALFCYIVFNQRKDPTNKRGYFQSSTILVSPVRAVAVMRAVVGRLNALLAQGGHQFSLVDSFFNSLAVSESQLRALLDKESFNLTVCGSEMKVLFNRVHDAERRLLRGHNSAQKAANRVASEGRLNRESGDCRARFWSTSSRSTSSNRCSRAARSRGTCRGFGSR